MYAKRQSLSEFRQENELKQQNEALKLQTFALQEKNQANKNEIAKKQERVKALSDLVTVEKRRTQEMQKAEQATRDALHEKEAKADALTAQIADEKRKTQKAQDTERTSREALQEKSAQMDRLMAQVNTLTGQLSDVQTRAGKLQIEQESIRNELRNAKTVTHPTSAAPTPTQERAGAGHRFIVLSPDMVEHNSTYRHVPYIFEVTPDNKASIVKDTSYYYYIEDDESRGLGSPGRTGYIKCDGPGDITYRLYNKQQDTWSYPAMIKAGESDVFEYGDNIRVNTVEIIPNASGTMYRLRFSPGIEQVFSEAEIKPLAV